MSHKTLLRRERKKKGENKNPGTGVSAVAQWVKNTMLFL